MPVEHSTDGAKVTDTLQASSGTSQGTAATETKRKYRRHPKPDENAPDRPPSAYVIFSNKIREDVKDQNLSFTQIAKLVGDRWQKLDSPGKEPFEVQASAAKEKYNILLSTYKKTDSYREYVQYLAQFRAKHGGGQIEQKRPKLEPASSGGSLSAKSLDVEGDLLLVAPSQGHMRGSSTGSWSSTVMPSPARLPLMSTSTSLDESARTDSPSSLQRLGMLSTQSSTSDDSSAKRSDSETLGQTASLTLNTPPSGTPPLLPPGPASAGSDHGIDVSKLRYPIGSLQTGPSAGPPLAVQNSIGYPFPGILPSPSMSETSIRSRGPDLRSHLDTGRSMPPGSAFPSGAPPGTISLPPLQGSSADWKPGMSTQRVLPFPRSSPTAHQPQINPLGSRASESPNHYRAGHGLGPSNPLPSLQRSESEAADTLAGLAGMSPSASKPDSSRGWDGQQRWPRR